MRTVSTHDVVQGTFELAELCAEKAESIAANHQTHAHLPPLNGLNMSHLSIIQSVELLSYYYDQWSRIEQWVVDEHGPEAIRRENEERIALLQKSTFILTMSAFEAAAKMALSLRNCPLILTGQRIYLGGIMKSSFPVGLIDATDAHLWEFAVELRNCIVHNNAVAGRSMKLDLEGGFALEMIAGRMTQGSPRRGMLLLKSVLLGYSRWCDALLTAMPSGTVATV